MAHEADIEEVIPLKNLPFTGITMLEYEPWEEGDPTPVNNVLIGCLGKVDSVSLVGTTKDGGTYFASSIKDVGEIISDLHEFIDFLRKYEEE